MKKIFYMAAVLSFILMGCSPDNINNNINTSSQITAGTYKCEILMEGGSGRASVESPANITVSDSGEIEATLIWSSPNYDYMIVNETKYLNEAQEGDNSLFTIPVPSFDTEFSAIGDTLAMSTPHEIEYTFTVLSPGKNISEKESSTENISNNTDISENINSINIDALTYNGSLKLNHAKEYSVDFYVDSNSNNYALFSIGNDSDIQYFIKQINSVPKQQLITNEKNIHNAENIKFLENVDKTYLVSTSVMDLIVNIDALNFISLSGTKATDWSIEEAVYAMESGSISYAGKYSAPDYELLLTSKCNLAIENTMIYHNPEVKEKLETLGIPVLVERSSYEKNPLGRLEWIKLYGLLYDRYDEALALYEDQENRVNSIDNSEISGLKIAFFSVTSNGSINVRVPGDYISTMIEMAGGIYVPQDLNQSSNSALSTMTITMEDFYLSAANADIIIYNSTIEGEISTIDELIGKSSIFEKFDAVKNGKVYCIDKNYFQHTTKIADFVEDIRNIIHENDTVLSTINKLSIN
ncbi:MAG: ABC transporter substrate-binding protein [Butyrivibrio sp.]|nr:ABC transporter substrate-binding protein [Butyrivibrio sp.]